MENYLHCIIMDKKNLDHDKGHRITAVKGSQAQWGSLQNQIWVWICVTFIWGSRGFDLEQVPLGFKWTVLYYEKS